MSGWGCCEGQRRRRFVQEELDVRGLTRPPFAVLIAVVIIGVGVGVAVADVAGSSDQQPQAQATAREVPCQSMPDLTPEDVQTLHHCYDTNLTSVPDGASSDDIQVARAVAVCDLLAPNEPGWCPGAADSAAK
jgi:hypothetical protein